MTKIFDQKVDFDSGELVVEEEEKQERIRSLIASNILWVRCLSLGLKVVGIPGNENRSKTRICVDDKLLECHVAFRNASGGADPFVGQHYKSRSGKILEVKKGKKLVGSRILDNDIDFYCFIVCDKEAKSMTEIGRGQFVVLPRGLVEQRLMSGRSSISLTGFDLARFPLHPALFKAEYL